MLGRRQVTTFGMLDGLWTPANGTTSDEHITSREFPRTFPSPQRGTGDAISVPQAPRPDAAGSRGPSALLDLMPCVVNSWREDCVVRG